MLEATADEGYTFSHWIGDVADADSPSTNIEMTEDKEVEAVFTQDQYTLSVNIIGEGEVTKDPDQEFYVYGDIIELEAIAADGWGFVNWTGDVAHLDAADAASATLTMHTDDVELTANFEILDYTLTLIADPPEGGEVIGEGEYNFGDEVLITATANEGWEFVNWTGDTEYLDDVNSAEAIVTMPSGNVSLTAVFQEEDDSDIIYGDGVTDIDDNFYTTVIIGDQEWMAENLRVTKYNNGNAIPTGLGDTQWGSTTSGAYAIYPHEGGPWDDGPIEGINSDAEMVTAYGKLYNWYAVDDERGLCPEGWSVPSDDDWIALVNYVVSQGFSNSSVSSGAGNALKSCRQVGSPLDGCNTSEHPRWNSHGLHSGFDEFGFSAFPGGLRSALGDGNYAHIGHRGFWWSSSYYSSSNAWYRNMDSDRGGVARWNWGYKKQGFSIRCLRDLD